MKSQMFLTNSRELCSFKEQSLSWEEVAP